METTNQTTIPGSRPGNHWVSDWVSARTESENSAKCYEHYINNFLEFCQKRGLSFESIVEDYRTAKYTGAREEQMFLDRWNDTLAAFSSELKKQYAPLSMMNILSVVKSFFGKWKIPVDLELPKRACVIYHNRDLTKPVIRAIIARASQRIGVAFLVLAESGLRAENIANLKYWQIKKDFEAGIVPMRIEIPSAELKDHVGDRWSFIGEDGYKALKEYLAPRMPLQDQDYVFPKVKAIGERKALTTAALSATFNYIVKQLKYERGAPAGKPGHFRLHGLRKYFRNNMKAEESYREFWMGHSLGVDEHYISRDPEVHRKRYAEGYGELRIMEPVTDQAAIEELRAQNEQLHQQIAELRKDSESFKQIVEILRDPKKLRQFEKWGSETPVEQKKGKS